MTPNFSAFRPSGVIVESYIKSKSSLVDLNVWINFLADGQCGHVGDVNKYTFAFSITSY